MFPRLGIWGLHAPFEIATPAKEGSPHPVNFPRRTSVRDLHTAFNLPYVSKLCRQQAEVIQNHENEHVRGIGQGEARHRKYERLKVGGGQAYDRSSD
jgi:hypothetical protein